MRVTVLPRRVDEKFRLYQFVPYSKLLPDEFNKFDSDAQEFVFNAAGGLTEKSSDLSKEFLLAPLDWASAAEKAVVRTHHWHGEVRASALRQHHQFILHIGRTHGWNVALEYDVRQCKAAESNIYHDLATPDPNMLLLIASKPTHIVSNQHTQAWHTSPYKRKTSETPIQSDRSPKRIRSEWFHCFQCGRTGHFPAQCQADRTVAGRTPFRLTPSPKNENALSSPDGKPLCIRWARSSNCHLGTSCSSAHICSLCGEHSHGNVKCPSVGP